MRSTTALCIVTLLLIFDFTTAQQGRIYDGYPIDISQAPHAAQVTYTRKHHSICVGGILSPYLVLTAAHCVKDATTLENMDYSVLTVTVGNTIHFDNTTGQTFTIKKVHIHPKFEGKYSKMRHDVAILRINGKITYNENAQPLKLPSPDEEPPKGREVLVSGWGTNPQNKHDRRLYQARMKIISPKICAKQHRIPLECFKKTELCLGEVTGHTCHGDSSAPAIDTITQSVLGLDSNSIGDCDKDHPIVFVKITDNLDFINSIMNEKSHEESDETCEH